MRRVFSPPCDTETIARLVDRENAIVEDLRSNARPERNHQRLECELAEIRRLLDLLERRRRRA